MHVLFVFLLDLVAVYGIVPLCGVFVDDLHRGKRPQRSTVSQKADREFTSRKKAFHKHLLTVFAEQREKHGTKLPAVFRDRVLRDAFSRSFGVGLHDHGIIDVRDILLSAR